MKCTECGWENPDDAYECANCGEEFVEPDKIPRPEQVERPLALSIIVTILCCLPVGAFAIYYALQVGRMLDEGDLDRARAMARRSRIIAFVAVALGVLFWVWFFHARQLFFWERVG